MRIRYNPLARDEVIKAAVYFDEQADGLGNRFLLEIDKTVSDIAASPLSWPITKYGTRKRIIVSPFPYSIHYKIVRGEVVIIAVAHQSRREDYWVSRAE